MGPVDVPVEEAISWGRLQAEVVLVRLNDIWEPYDCIGDVSLGIEVACAMLDGRVESEVLWSGEYIARSNDILIRRDGSRVSLFRQYHGPALVGAIFQRRRETRRVSFT